MYTELKVNFRYKHLNHDKISDNVSLHKKVINKHKLKFTILPKRVTKCMLCQVMYVTIVL